MYQELYPTLLAKEKIRGIEEIYLTHSSGKWLIITTKKIKHQAQQDIDTIINEGEIPSTPDRLFGRIFNKQNHQDFILYANIIKSDEK